MNDFLHALAVALAIVLVTGMVGIALILRALVRANRVVVGRRSTAPIGWLWSWRRAPRLHRRLRRATRTADAAVARLGHTTAARRAEPATPLHEVAAELGARAAFLDDRLVATSHLHPSWGAGPMAELSAEVRDLEASAHRLQQVSAQWRFAVDRAVPGPMIPLPDLHERLDAVEAALHELPTGV